MTIKHHLAPIVLSLLIIAPLIVFEGPGGVENFIAPVAVDIRHEVTKNTKHEVCVTTTLTRNRNGTATSLRWTARGPFGRPVLIVPYRPNERVASTMIIEPRKAGDKVVWINCHIRPPQFGTGAYTLELKVDYEVKWQGLWDVLRRDPPVYVHSVGGAN